jgi:isorenieratene synthase
MKHVVVIGGGMAGLAAAYALGRAGVRVSVFEAAPFVGGRLATVGRVSFSYGGTEHAFPIEHGLHGIFRHYVNFRALLAEVAPDTELRPSRSQDFVFVGERGELHQIEIGARVRESILPSLFALMKVQVAPEVARAQTFTFERLKASLRGLELFAFDPARDAARLDERSVADFIAGWPPVQAALVRALTRSGSFAEPEETSLGGFVAGLVFYAFGDKRNSAFDVFALETERAVIAPLVRAIEAHGGAVRTNAPVTRVLVEAGRAVGVLVGEELVRADAVVLAVDPPAYRKLALASDPALAADAPDFGIGFPTLAVRVFTTRDVSRSRAETGVFAGLPGDAYFWLHRLQDPFAAWHARTGGGVLEVHLYGDRARRAATLEDAVVADEVVALATRAWPEVSGSVVHTHVQRNPPAQVAFPPGSATKLPGTSTKLPNIARCGDWITLDPWTYHLERATATGFAAARGVAAALVADVTRMPTPRVPEVRSRSMRAAAAVLGRWARASV